MLFNQNSPIDTVSESGWSTLSVSHTETEKKDQNNNSLVYFRNYKHSFSSVIKIKVTNKKYVHVEYNILEILSGKCSFVQKCEALYHTSKLNKRNQTNKNPNGI